MLELLLILPQGRKIAQHPHIGKFYHDMKDLIFERPIWLTLYRALFQITQTSSDALLRPIR